MPNPPRAHTATTVVRAATVMVPTGPVDNAEVVVEDGVIAAVRGATGPVPDVVLSPGFVDLQVNGIGAVDVAGAAGADWDVLDRALLAQGVTTWCPTLVSAPVAALEASLARVAGAMDRSPAPRPDIAGVHLEGPFLAVPGAHRPEVLRPSVDAAWLGSLLPVVRIVTLAPELPGALDAVAALSGAGVLVSLGHSACSAECALDAVDAGARLVTHLGNAMGPLHQRAPGLIGAALADGRVAVSVIADTVHTHPVFVRAAFAAKGPGGVALVTDAVAHPAHGDGPPRLPDGTLAGSVLSMDDAVSNAVTHSAVALPDALSSASTTPAALLAMDDRGAIAPGRRADLVALAAAGPGRWQVTAVWVRGRPAWPGSEWGTA